MGLDSSQNGYYNEDGSQYSYLGGDTMSEETAVRFTIVLVFLFCLFLIALFRALKLRQAIDEEDEEETGGIYELQL